MDILMLSRHKLASESSRRHLKTPRERFFSRCSIYEVSQKSEPTTVDNEQQKPK